jgi:hypothetical protein
METQKKSHENCCANGGRRKRIIGAVMLVVVICIILFAAAVAAKAKLHEENTVAISSVQGSGFAPAMYPSPSSLNDDPRQFTIPSDATKSGEILMQVSSADQVSKNISTIASTYGGTVYATYIAYSPSDGAKDGFIVVRVDENQFDAAYGALKNLGSKIIQESSKDISRYPYAVPMASQGSAVAADNSQPQVIAPPTLPAYPQGMGYIKVNFVEAAGGKVYNSNRNGGPDILGGPGYQGMGLRKNIFVVLAIKSIAVIALIFIIIILVARLLKHMRQRKAERKRPVVRQQAKTRKRVVRIAKKK